MGGEWRVESLGRRSPPLRLEATGVSLDFSELCAREQPALLRLGYCLVSDAEEARELVQDTLVHAYLKRHSLRDPLAAPAWLRRILVRRAVTHFRRRRVWDRVRDLLQPRPGPPAPSRHDELSPESQLARQERLEQVMRAAAQLSAQQRAAFSLRYLAGLDVDEVARAMGVGPGTAKTHLRRALEALREVLGPQQGE